MKHLFTTEVSTTHTDWTHTACTWEEGSYSWKTHFSEGRCFCLLALSFLLFLPISCFWKSGVSSETETLLKEFPRDLDVFLSSRNWAIPLGRRSRLSCAHVQARHQDSSLNCFHCDQTTSSFTVWLEGPLRMAMSLGPSLFTVLLENVRQSSVVVLIICHVKAVVLSSVVVVTHFHTELYRCQVASFYHIPHLQHRGLQKHWAKYKIYIYDHWQISMSKDFCLFVDSSWNKNLIKAGEMSPAAPTCSCRRGNSCCAKLDISSMCLYCLFETIRVNTKNEYLL